VDLSSGNPAFVRASESCSSPSLEPFEDTCLLKTLKRTFSCSYENMKEGINLQWLENNFDRGLYVFYTNEEASFQRFRRGPCIHFHVRTIKKLENILKSGSYAQVCNDSEYIELLYATLTAWGMNELRGGPELQDFEEFEKNIKGLDVGMADCLGKYRLNDLEASKLEELKSSIEGIYTYLADRRIMRTDKAIVGVSKTLHHLFPHLLVPVDKKHIINLLANLKEEEYRTSSNQYDTFENYWKCIKVSHYLAKALSKRGIVEVSDWKPDKPNFQIKNRPMDTSIPKMIDNALIGLNP